jgi:hypothetical protein
VSEVIVVDDVVSEDCVRKLHVMSNEEINLLLPANAWIERTVEAGVYHLRAEWMYCGMLDIKPRCWPKPRRLLVWSLGVGDSCHRHSRHLHCTERSAVQVWRHDAASAEGDGNLPSLILDAIKGAVEMWTKMVGWEPKFAWMHSLPKCAKWGQEVYGCILLEAKWVPRNCVAVGGRL